MTDNSRSIPLDSQKTHSYINFLFLQAAIFIFHFTYWRNGNLRCRAWRAGRWGGRRMSPRRGTRWRWWSWWRRCSGPPSRSPAAAGLDWRSAASCSLTFCGSNAAVHLKWIWNRKFENILKEEQSRFHSGNKNYLFNSFFLPLEQRRIKSNVLLSPSKKREKSLEGLFCWYGRCLWLGSVQPQTLDRWVSAVSGYLYNAELSFSSNDPQHISKYRYL